MLIRFGTYLTVPGIRVKKNLSAQSAGQFFNLLSLLGGGSFGKFSILALGVSPYITASIIVQLLSTDLVPVFTRWAKGGVKGRRKLERLTKIITIPFALLQGLALIFTLTSRNAISPKWNDNSFGVGPQFFYYFLVPICLLAGTMFMLWLADQVSIKGLGNGISLIIFAGIVARLPFSLERTFQFWILPNSNQAGILLAGIIKFTVYMVIFLLLILFVVFFYESERRIPIEHTGSGLRGQSDYRRSDSYLPLKINSAGVIPVIFASALISAPVTVSQIIEATQPNNHFVLFVKKYLFFNTWSGIGIYGVMTILFTFMYAQIQMNPDKIAENFQKSGTFIPGIKPGNETADYLRSMIHRLSCVGAIALALIAVCPYIVSKLTALPQYLAIGGTGMIIMVSVGLQTVRYIRGLYIQQKFIAEKKTAHINSNQFLW